MKFLKKIASFFVNNVEPEKSLNYDWRKASTLESINRMSLALSDKEKEYFDGILLSVFSDSGVPFHSNVWSQISKDNDLLGYLACKSLITIGVNLSISGFYTKDLDVYKAMVEMADRIGYNLPILLPSSVLESSSEES